MFQVNENGLLILTDALGEILTRVQRRGNSEVTYQTDVKTYGYTTPEKWAYPKEDGVKLIGDCEDISIYKHHLLVEEGVPITPLLLTICKDPNGGGHCVLCVCTEDKDFIMCNSHEVLVTPRTMIREGYTFLYRQGFGRKMNEPWDVLK